MIIGRKGVKYGLTILAPKGNKSAPKKGKAPVFGEEDSDDDHDNVERQIARHQARKQEDKKVAEIQAACLDEDPSIFDYDVHYDAIQEARDVPRRQEKLQRKSRYIEGLLEKAEERKREQDVLYEKQLLKEREAEDHLFGTKERFVTAAYKKKLEEDRRILEEQSRKQAEEEANAVEKKGHMGDFYRNLLQNNVAFGTGRKGEDARPNQAVAEASTVKVVEADDGPPTGNPDWEEHAAHKAAGPSRQEADFGSQRCEQAREFGPGPSHTASSGPRLEGRAHAVAHEPAEQEEVEVGDAVQEAPKLSRADAVAAARERYLARKRKAVDG